MAKRINKEGKATNNKKAIQKNALSDQPLYELPQTKAVLKPLIDAGEAVAEALEDGTINFSEWIKIVWEGVPLAQALKNLPAFVAETQILNSHPEAKKQLFDWFESEFDLPEDRARIERIVERTIQYALNTWSFVVFMQQEFVKPKAAAKAAAKK